MSDVDVVAEAIYREHWGGEPKWKQDRFHTLHPDDQDEYRRMARTAILLVQKLSEPRRHVFDTNGFPVETCKKCGFPEDEHLTVQYGVQWPEGGVITSYPNKKKAEAAQQTAQRFPATKWVKLVERDCYVGAWRPCTDVDSQS